MGKDTGVINYTPRPMSPDDKSYRDVVMLFSDQPIKPKYWFEDFGDYWSCSCGQINREETCSNCGLARKLLRQIFVLHKPSDDATAALSDDSSAEAKTVSDDKSDEQTSKPSSGEKELSGEKEDPAGDPSARQEDEETIIRRRKKRTRIILIILTLLILLLGGGLAAFYYHFLPEINKRNEANAATAADSLEKELPEAMTTLNGASFSVYVNAGDAKFGSRKYQEAISYYAQALKIRSDDSISQKILKAKYCYVTLNQENGGSTFKKYLDDLKKANYPGIQSIYDRYYTWDASIVTNTDPNDYSTDMDSINRINSIYFHTTFSGGPPGEDLDLYYEILWPDGSSERKAISSSKSSGETVTTRCSYTYPPRPGESRLTYKLFNNRDHSLLATDSVSLH